MFYRAIRNLDDIATKAGDTRVRFVVVDALSKMQQRQTPKVADTLNTMVRHEYQIIAKGRLSTDVEQFNYAINGIKDNHGIVVPIDPYLEITGPVFLEDIRKVS